MTVTDGSGHPGMPLYATVVVSAPLINPVTYYTNPITGQVAFTLYRNETYTLDVSAVGYSPQSRTKSIQWRLLQST